MLLYKGIPISGYFYIGIPLYRVHMVWQAHLAEGKPCRITAGRFMEQLQVMQQKIGQMENAQGPSSIPQQASSIKLLQELRQTLHRVPPSFYRRV